MDLITDLVLPKTILTNSQGGRPGRGPFTLPVGAGPLGRLECFGPKGEQYNGNITLQSRVDVPPLEAVEEGVLLSEPAVRAVSGFLTCCQCKWHVQPPCFEKGSFQNVFVLGWSVFSGVMVVPGGHVG